MTRSTVGCNWPGQLELDWLDPLRSDSQLGPLDSPKSFYQVWLEGMHTPLCDTMIPEVALSGFRWAYNHSQFHKLWVIPVRYYEEMALSIKIESNTH